MMVSSAGRAPDYHSGCHGFDSRTNTSVKTDSSSDDAQASRSTLKPKGGRRLMESVLVVLMANRTTVGTALQGSFQTVGDDAASLQQSFRKMIGDIDLTDRRKNATECEYTTVDHKPPAPMLAL